MLLSPAHHAPQPCHGLSADSQQLARSRARPYGRQAHHRGAPWREVCRMVVFVVGHRCRAAATARRQQRFLDRTGSFLTFQHFTFHPHPAPIPYPPCGHMAAHEALERSCPERCPRRNRRQHLPLCLVAIPVSPSAILTLLFVHFNPSRADHLTRIGATF